MALPSRLSSIVGIWGFAIGPIGSGRILHSRPYAWLRPDFVPPSPFLVIKDPLTQVVSDFG